MDYRNENIGLPPNGKIRNYLVANLIYSSKATRRIVLSSYFSRAVLNVKQEIGKFQAAQKFPK